MTHWRDRILLAIGTAFGLGRAPVAPGTAGALLGVGIFAIIALAAPIALQTWPIALALLVVCVLTVIWAFLLTRVLDIIKPPPARQLERLPCGWGTLADDLCSSLYAVGLLHIGAACFPRLFGSGV